MLMPSHHIWTPLLDSPLYRVIPADRFDDLITTSELFFQNLSKMPSDINDGLINEATVDAIHQDLLSQGAAEVVLKFATYTPDIFRKYFCASCWRYGTFYEKIWDKYLPNNIDGVAIVTTVQKLLSNFDNSTKGRFYHGLVQYTDGAHMAGLGQVCIKAKEFSWENEFRVLWQDTSAFTNDGNYLIIEAKPLRYRIDLQSTIDEIIVSPFASDGYKQKVEDMLDKLKLSAVVSAA